MLLMFICSLPILWIYYVNNDVQFSWNIEGNAIRFYELNLGSIGQSSNRCASFELDSESSRLECPHKSSLSHLITYSVSTDSSSKCEMRQGDSAYSFNLDLAEGCNLATVDHVRESFEAECSGKMQCDLQLHVDLTPESCRVSDEVELLWVLFKCQGDPVLISDSTRFGSGRLLDDKESESVSISREQMALSIVITDLLIMTLFIILTKLQWRETQ